MGIQAVREGWISLTVEGLSWGGVCSEKVSQVQGQTLAHRCCLGFCIPLTVQALASFPVCVPSFPADNVGAVSSLLLQREHDSF